MYRLLDKGGWGVKAQELADTCRFYSSIRLFCKEKKWRKRGQSTISWADCESSQHRGPEAAVLAEEIQKQVRNEAEEREKNPKRRPDEEL